MTAPEPPAVWWTARTGELATDYTAGMVFLDEYHRPPADAVRLVPDTHEVACPSCGATIRARMADAPERPGVTALRRRCDEKDARYGGSAPWHSDEIRALLCEATDEGGDR